MSMNYPCDDCPYLAPDCPTVECDAYGMWAWEEFGDDS